MPAKPFISVGWYFLNDINQYQVWAVVGYNFTVGEWLSQETIDRLKANPDITLQITPVSPDAKA